MKSSLAKVTIKKEGVHWGRMGELFGEMEGIGGAVFAYPILVLIFSVCHYAYAFMHTSFEIYLFIFNRTQYKKNINAISKQLLKKENE